MTAPTITTRKRLASVASLAVLGGALVAAAWVGGSPGLAAGMAVILALAGVAAFLWSGRNGDIAAIIRLSGDERQQRMDQRAVAITAYVMIYACIAGMVVDLARGGDGWPYAQICAVGGVTYMIALAVLHRRT